MTRPLISSDRAVKGGVPCFAGTRVPIEVVLPCLEQGDSMVALTRAYPFLTAALVRAATAYVDAHGRPPRQPLAQVRSDLQLKSRKLVRR